jgi:hypothetical protein
MAATGEIAHVKVPSFRTETLALGKSAQFQLPFHGFGLKHSSGNDGVVGGEDLTEPYDTYFSRRHMD